MPKMIGFYWRPHMAVTRPIVHAWWKFPFWKNIILVSFGPNGSSQRSKNYEMESFKMKSKLKFYYLENIWFRRYLQYFDSERTWSSRFLELTWFFKVAADKKIGIYFHIKISYSAGYRPWRSPAGWSSICTHDHTMAAQI